LIHPLPKSSFNSTFNCFGDNTEINNTSTITSGSIDLNQWSVDGNNFNTKNVTYKFPDVNTYSVELITTSNEGCKDTLIQDVIINPLPELLISLDSDTGCIPFDIQVVNNSTIQSGSISEYLYNWGDGNSSVGSNPGFTYTSPGKYSVSIRGTSDKGCVDSVMLSDSVVVFDNPKADFYYTPEDPSTLKNVITLVDSSSKDAIDWIWTVSDGGSYSGSSAQHTFIDSGNYIVTLRIINNNGCFDEETKVIYVNADLFIHIPNGFSPNGDGINDTYGLAGMTQGVFQMEMDIYNQWGEKVFHSENVNDRWDGTYQGEPAQQGVYLFRVKYTNPKQTKWYYNNGEIHLMR
jgi:gliding motility-associated-like protein